MFNLLAHLLVVLTLFLGQISTTEALPSGKFEQWYPAYRHHFEQSYAVVCRETLNNYLQYAPHPATTDVNLYAAHHADCVLENTTETIKANMASAGVVLGLMPFSLSYLGPTLSESGIVMLQRPILAVLLVFGGPAIYPTRVFKHHDPFEALKVSGERPATATPAIFTESLVRIFEYSFASAAAINVVFACLELGFKTVGSYKWRDGGEGEFIADRKLTALRTERDDPAGRTGSVHSYILGVLAGLICLAHQALGVIIFSSLLFIGVKDTFPILARFAVSAVVVQAIRTFEVKTVLAGRSLSTRF